MRRTRPFTLPALAIAIAALAPALAGAAEVAGRVTLPDGSGVAGAVVFVNAPVANRPAGAAPTAVMNQIDRMFVPGVLPVVAGTRVHFPNKDQIQHHVYSFSRTKTFELPLYRGTEAPPVVFDAPGVVRLGCNIHDWMSAVILVVPTPHFAVTDDAGRYALRGLPAGEYSLIAWHERSRQKTAELTRVVRLGKGGVTQDFELVLHEKRDRPAEHGVRSDP
jgi:plastocyanin